MEIDRELLRLKVRNELVLFAKEIIMLSEIKPKLDRATNNIMLDIEEVMCSNKNLPLP